MNSEADKWKCRYERSQIKYNELRAENEELLSLSPFKLSEENAALKARVGQLETIFMPELHARKKEGE